MSGIGAYVAALPAGAVVTALILHRVGQTAGHLPVQMVRVVAFASAIAGSNLIRMRLPESWWQIPKGWWLFGHTAYAALFGGILGLGVLTAIPSAGFYVLVVWAVAAERWQDVWPVFLAFGVARAFPLPLLAIIARRGQEYPLLPLERFSALITRICPAEIALLAAIGVLCVVPVGL